ncbi:MAG: DUF1549 domain-containing protein [Nannocystaceae bacterium]|nr:DUF1549 domain-containing protein [Nannocystaceae bacterium]
MKKSVITNTLAGLVLILPLGCGGGGGDDEMPDMDDAGDTGGESGDDANVEESGEDTDGDDDADEDEGTDDSPMVEACDEMTFTNVVDEANCPLIQGLGVDPEPADKVEFCRRAYIDLLGEAPTGDEYEAACKWRTTEEIVDAFMIDPRFVQHSQRMWADIFHYTSDIVHHQYIIQLDDLVRQLYVGEINYDTFVELASTHPAFLGRWDGNDLVGFNFQAFLGRDATGPERLALVPLFALWEERAVPHAMQADAQNVVLNTLNCAVPNEASCFSDFWGEHTVLITPPVPGDVDPDGPNVIDQTSLLPAQWDSLRTFGRLLTEQPQFYEAYVDRAFKRYLGYDGDTIPEARQALVDMMDANGGDLLAIDREIMTSSLYTATNAWAEEEKIDAMEYDPAIWHGPVKQMDPEDWLRSAAKLTGVDLGSCDHRFPTVQSGTGGFHPNNYPDMGGAPDYAFRDRAQLLGGCPDRVTLFRSARTGLIAALTQATLTAELCEAADESSPIYPLQFAMDDEDKSDEALTTAANQIWSAAVIRQIPEGAADALEAGVEGCQSLTSCVPQQFAVETCRLTLKATDFLFY